MSGSPFDLDYKPQVAPVKKISTRAHALKQAMKRAENGSAFDRYPLRLTEAPGDQAKTALIKTPSSMRPRETGDA